MKELGVILGGPQGAGLETSMFVLSRALARLGYGVLANREYFSNIVGRHSYIHMIISSERLPRSLRYPVELMASMDAETIFTHFDDIGEKGVVIYDKTQAEKKIDDVASMEDYTKERIKKRLREANVEPVVGSVAKYLEREKRVAVVELDYSSVLRRLIERHRIDPKQLSRYLSGIIVSSVAAALSLDEDAVRHAFEQQFRERKQLVEHNLALLEIVYEEMRDYRGILRLDDPSTTLDKVMIASGNDVVAMGKLVGGVRYQSYYPITPAADESFLLEKYEYVEGEDRIGPVIVMQTEDEIAAITSAIGAALTGARSSTATSGPGFDLMVEGLSWAGANEAPVVITYYQRGGPSTGQPTRGSQSDLMNALFAAHGEFARVVISSGDHVEAFYDAVEAFNIAERFQVPVIHLLDKFLANSLATLPVPKVEGLAIDRGLISKGGAGYKRFDLGSLVSPRAFLGAKGTVMWYSGDEHDEYGHIVEDPENRVMMYSKRIRKMELISREIPSEKKLVVYGDRSPDYMLIGWGSTKGVALDAVELLERRGLKGMYVNLKLLWPFPARELKGTLNLVPADRIVAVEHSYGVNISSLIAMETGFVVQKKIAKFTGRSITLNELVEALERTLLKGEDKVVLTYGA